MEISKSGDDAESVNGGKIRQKISKKYEMMQNKLMEVKLDKI